MLQLGGKFRCDFPGCRNEATVLLRRAKLPEPWRYLAVYAGPWAEAAINPRVYVDLCPYCLKVIDLPKKARKAAQVPMPKMGPGKKGKEA